MGKLVIRWRKKLVRRNNRDTTFVVVPPISILSVPKVKAQLKAQPKRPLNHDDDTDLIPTQWQREMYPIEGVSTTGVIDLGSDLTNIRGDLLYHIVKKDSLKIEDLETPQLKACTYDQNQLF